ncbi:hypothetical protein VTH06DRAFT_6925 [Thermothelomyces fergusii]|jgi:hypothetical protein
MPKT